MVRWGKVRILNGGDKIRAKVAVSELQYVHARDSSFVRVSSLLYHEIWL